MINKLIYGDVQSGKTQYIIDESLKLVKLGYTVIILLNNNKSLLLQFKSRVNNPFYFKYKSIYFEKINVLLGNNNNLQKCHKFFINKFVKLAIIIDEADLYNMSTSNTLTRDYIVQVIDDLKCEILLRVTATPQAFLNLVDKYPILCNDFVNLERSNNYYNFLSSDIYKYNIIETDLHIYKHNITNLQKECFFNILKKTDNFKYPTGLWFLSRYTDDHILLKNLLLSINDKSIILIANNNHVKCYTLNKILNFKSISNALTYFISHIYPVHIITWTQTGRGISCRSNTVNNNFRYANFIVFSPSKISSHDENEQIIKRIGGIFNNTPTLEAFGTTQLLDDMIYMNNIKENTIQSILNSKENVYIHTLNVASDIKYNLKPINKSKGNFKQINYLNKWYVESTFNHIQKSNSLEDNDTSLNWYNNNINKWMSKNNNSKISKFIKIIHSSNKKEYHENELLNILETCGYKHSSRYLHKISSYNDKEFLFLKNNNEYYFIFNILNNDSNKL